MKKAEILPISICVLFVLTGCDTKQKGSTGNAEVNACVARGISYFKEVGSYPTLKSAPNAGRSAEEVALERCNRTLTAF
ncbi:hypothetical protein [Pseudomonas zhanjiangensis]|uniref:Lipoprotein n=1 Tax=Pseudomonas zhanjiangensis TaxID=3239015 RepID=A0ABV3YV41_9PSED